MLLPFSHQFLLRNSLFCCVLARELLEVSDSMLLLVLVPVSMLYLQQSQHE